MLGKPCINLTFQPTAREGHQYLAITTEGGGILPHHVRSCLERRITCGDGQYLVFGGDGTTVVNLYEPTPLPWDELLTEVEKALRAEYEGVEITLPPVSASASTA